MRYFRRNYSNEILQEKGKIIVIRYFRRNYSNQVLQKK
jgi:hypothetical protein